MPRPESVDTDHMEYSQEMFHNFMNRLYGLFSEMDQKYAEAASHYGFYCTGCEDNCCSSLFYHYSLLEYSYIRAGLKILQDRQKDHILLAAEKICRPPETDKSGGRSSRNMCPLNIDGLCILYPYRPMICRLHGIPHELRKPGHPIAYGSGCDTFNKRCRGKGYFRFDRTPFYTEMACIEKEFRKTVGFDGKIKMTVAQMLLDNRHHESR